MNKQICTTCFESEGIKLTALKYGLQNPLQCKNCNSIEGKLLSNEDLYNIAQDYFVHGSFYYSEYGGAPIIQFNEYQTTNVKFSKYVKSDIKIFERALGVGFFYYGPRMSYFGEIEPLQNLKKSSSSQEVLDEIISKFPQKEISQNDTFYRLRTKPEKPHLIREYDSPNLNKSGKGRLDSTDFSVLYASTDIEICLHECRVSILDELYVAKLRPTKTLRILDLTAHIEEEGTEFESLGLSIFYLFRAEDHSYEICRQISKHAYASGFDGIQFPSYFNKVKTANYSNIAIFGRPVEKGLLTVESIDRVQINTVDYGYSYGPLLED
ncbi:MAG: RES family NAD+ phosphorylase [Bacteroidota bacterium]